MSTIATIPIWIIVYAALGLLVRFLHSIAKGRIDWEQPFYAWHARVEKAYRFTEAAALLFGWLSIILAIIVVIVTKDWLQFGIVLGIGVFVWEVVNRQQSDMKMRKKAGEHSVLAGEYLEMGTKLLKEGEMQRTFEYYEKALAEFEHLNDKEGIGATLMSMSLAYRYCGDLPKSIDYAQRSIQHLRDTKHLQPLASTLSGLGAVYIILGTPKEALEHLEQADRLLLETGNNYLRIPVHMNLGDAYRALGQSEQAVVHYDKGIQIFENLQEDDKENFTESDQAMASLAAGVLYTYRGKPVDAQTCLTVAEPMLRRTGYWDGLIMCYTHLANIYEASGKHEESITALRKGIEIAERLRNPHAKASLQLNLGMAYLLTDQPQSALHFLNQAIVELQRQNDGGGIAMCLASIGQAYITSKEYNKAKETLENAKQIADLINIPLVTAIVYQNLGLLSLATDQEEKALQYFEYTLPRAFQTGVIGLILTPSILVATLIQNHPEWNRQSDAIKILENALQVLMQSGLPEEAIKPGVDGLKELLINLRSTTIDGPDTKVESNETRSIPTLTPSTSHTSHNIQLRVQHETQRADDLLAIAQRFLYSDSQEEVKRALEEYADPAQKIYQRHNSPRNKEALKIVGLLYKRLVDLDKGSS